MAPDPRAKTTGESLEQTTIQSAIEDFFGHIDEGTEEEGGREQRADKGRIRRRGDGRADSVVDALIRVLIRKEPVRQADVDAAFERAFARLPSLLNAELVLVHVLQQKNRILSLGRGSQLVLAHAFQGSGLFAGKPSATLKFDQGIVKLKQSPLDPTKGILGICLQGRVSRTTHDTRSDKDFTDEVGKATGFETRSMLTVPIVDGQEVFGVVQVRNKDRASGAEFFSTQDQQLVEEVARHVARIVRRFNDPKLETGEGDMARYVAHLARTEALDLLKPDPRDPRKLAVELDAALWVTVGLEAIKKYQVLPLRAPNDGTVDVVMANPLDASRRRYFELATERSIGEAFAATPSQIQAVLAQKLEKTTAVVQQNELLDKVASAVAAKPIDVAEVERGGATDTPVVQLVNHLIEDAHARGASDIHIEAGERETRIRFRIDGNLSERMKLTRQAHDALIARLKIMAPPMKIDERRLPQDGKIKFKNYSQKGVDIDIRVATSPSTHGERAVLRLLAKQSISLGLDAMGFSPENLEAFRWAARQPYGMVLCCGPTGSGKTTTLYAALSEINTVDVNILTAEDPVEYPLAGITQVQINKKIGLGFARALKSFLRMDPDVILVGEIRDRRTANTAIEASLTGHLLLSTLHTNDAASTVTRFVEMKVEPFLVSSCLLLVSAQRLARRLCTDCREPWTPTPPALELLAADPHPTPKSIWKASDQGCQRCNGSGYKGRVGIHEILAMHGEMGNAVRDLVHRKASSETIKSRAVELGMRTMWQDALWKVKEGITDLREVAAIVRADSGEAGKLARAAKPIARTPLPAAAPRGKTSTRRTPRPKAK